jgi:hypothetical protein
MPSARRTCRRPWMGRSMPSGPSGAGMAPSGRCDTWTCDRSGTDRGRSSASATTRPSTWHCPRWDSVSFHGPHAGFEHFPRRRRRRSGRSSWTPPPPGTASAGTAGDAPRHPAGGRAEGPLVGGNLALLAASCGTPYQPDTRGAILFLEDVGEALYRVDGCSSSCSWPACLLNGIAAVAVGEFTEMLDPVTRETAGGEPSLEGLLEELLTPLGVPVVMGLPIGHGRQNWTLPLGVRARWTPAGGPEILEPATAEQGEPRMSRIYTRTGDTGDTGLFGGGRVSQVGPAGARLRRARRAERRRGLGRHAVEDPELGERLTTVQRDLFAIGAHLATPPGARSRPHLPELPLNARPRWRRGSTRPRRGGAAGLVHPARRDRGRGGAARRPHRLPAGRAGRRGSRRAETWSRGSWSTSTASPTSSSSWPALANARAGVEETPWKTRT